MKRLEFDDKFGRFVLFVPYQTTKCISKIKKNRFYEKNRKKNLTLRNYSYNFVS